MAEHPSFLFLTCQVGAERAVKGEVARRWPAFRLSYSRPGFLTFKLPAGHLPADDFHLASVFARGYAFSLGKAAGANVAERARAVWQLAGDRPFERLHVWQRDAAPPGEHGFHPGRTPLAAEAEEAIRRERFDVAPLELEAAAASGDAVRRQAAGTIRSTLAAGSLARPGQLVLDCVLVQADEWWVGFHRARGWASRRPGGLSRLELPPDAVSRAYLKMEESLRWSRLPVEAGERCVEIGCAPGGSCQALLKRGLRVMGIDPAAMQPAVLAHPNFVHVRKRGADVRRRLFRQVRWLTADMNVAPNYTLDTVEGIVTHRQVNVRGLLLTLKLVDWGLADHVPEYLARIRSWGFAYVRARQLQHNGQEICVAALRKRPRRRGPGRPAGGRAGW